MARIKSLANSEVEGKEMEATLVPKEGQRAECGEEARVMMQVHGQEWNCWRNTLIPSCRIDLKGILGSGKL
jgi:hypothetical protein